ncbi:MAG TPA: alpha/beta fold hydrolase [Candidatus Binatia bacterium]|nr:alpha/beta fold hydrolase [Candidatus Binatia bacterium]
MIGAALLGALALGSVPAAMFLLQDHLIFFPQPLVGPGPAPRPGLEEVEIAGADDTRLRGWLALPRQRPAPLVLYFGGNAEEVSWLVEMAPRLGDWGFLLVNFRGYGRSEGQPGERALFADALRLHDWASARPDVDAARIAVMGRSLGSGVAVHLAAERPIAGVVLVTPFDSLTAVAQHHYPWLPVRWMLRHPFDSLSRAPRLQAPLLCLAAGSDRIIPSSHSARLYAAWGGPKRWIEFPAADHDSVATEPGYWPAIAEFLAGLR